MCYKVEPIYTDTLRLKLCQFMDYTFLDISVSSVNMIAFSKISAFQ